METRIAGGACGSQTSLVAAVAEQPARIVGNTSPLLTTLQTSGCGTINAIATATTVAKASSNVGVGHTTGVSMTHSTAGASTVVVVSSPTGTGQSTHHHQNPTGISRILSRNVNGTLVQTSVPQNEAELQLYRVMQRASLLGYYDTLLEMGGDDVQQLCDAGEEEFLEIMALVGMASKPLHVRRLQKALQEWITNPSMFQTPVVPATSSSNKITTTGSSSYVSAGPRPQQSQTSGNVYSGNLQQTTTLTPGSYAPTTHVTLTPLPCRSASPVIPVANVPTHVSTSTFRHTPSPNPPIGYATSHSPGIMQVGDSSCGSGTTPSPSGGGAPASPTQPTPTLLPSQVQRLAEAAERLASNIRPLDPKPHNVKKKICKNLEMVMTIPDNDPRRMEEIRKYAAIYGRFDCKRKPEKPLTLHEVSVNEAAAQICRFVPALLTRRDELFPLARRVVRDSGYHYSKGQYLSMSRSRGNGEETDLDRLKRRHLELEVGEGEDTSQTELDLRCSSSDLNSLNPRRHDSSRHWQCFSPVWRKKSNNGIFGTSIEEISDSDSQFSFSNEESLSMPDPIECEADNTEHESDFNLKVIASRGDNIIAVANPALMECNRPIKKEPEDETSTL